MPRYCRHCAPRTSPRTQWSACGAAPRWIPTRRTGRSTGPCHPYQVHARTGAQRTFRLLLAPHHSRDMPAEKFRLATSVCNRTPRVLLYRPGCNNRRAYRVGLFSKICLMKWVNFRKRDLQYMPFYDCTPASRMAYLVGLFFQNLPTSDAPARSLRPDVRLGFHCRWPTRPGGGR